MTLSTLPHWLKRAIIAVSSTNDGILRTNNVRVLAKFSGFAQSTWSGLPQGWKRCWANNSLAFFAESYVLKWRKQKPRFLWFGLKLHWGNITFTRFAVVFGLEKRKKFKIIWKKAKEKLTCKSCKNIKNFNLGKWTGNLFDIENWIRNTMLYAQIFSMQLFVVKLPIREQEKQ